MSKSNAFETDFLKLILWGTAIADLAQNDGSSPATSLYLSLHTADPGEAGDQTTNEIAYTSYVRKAVLRDNTGFAISGAVASLVADNSFAAGTGGSGTATHFGLGVASAGAGYLLWSGTVTPNIVCGNGVTPILTTGTTITED